LAVIVPSRFSRPGDAQGRSCTHAQVFTRVEVVGARDVFEKAVEAVNITVVQDLVQLLLRHIRDELELFAAEELGNAPALQCSGFHHTGVGDLLGNLGERILVRVLRVEIPGHDVAPF
jgi:hypothetical protein